MRGSISNMLTSEPKRRNIDANSTPTAPAPMIISDFGTCVRFRISMLVRMNSAIRFQAGQHAGFRAGRDQDVLRLEGLGAFVAFDFDLLDVARVLLMVAKPGIHSTLFFFIRNSTPLACF